MKNPSTPASGRSSFVRMFKPQFAPLVEAGIKLQTVRPTPKRVPKPGDKISLRAWRGKPYRSKQRVLMDSTISQVSKIVITEIGYEHWDDGWRVMMTPESLNAFAIQDGFSGWTELVQWFQATHGLPFVGIVIHWNDQRNGAADSGPPQQ